MAVVVWRVMISWRNNNEEVTATWRCPSPRELVTPDQLKQLKLGDGGGEGETHAERLARLTLWLKVGG